MRGSVSTSRVITWASLAKSQFSRSAACTPLWGFIHRPSEKSVLNKHIVQMRGGAHLWRGRRHSRAPRPAGRAHASAARGAASRVRAASAEFRCAFLSPRSLFQPGKESFFRAPTFLLSSGSCSNCLWCGFFIHSPRAFRADEIYSRRPSSIRVKFFSLFLYPHSD